MGEDELLQQQEEETEYTYDPAKTQARGKVPAGAFVGAQAAGAQSTTLTTPVNKLPTFLSSLQPNEIYLGLPRSSDGYIDEAGSGKAFRNFYGDVDDIAAAAAPLWLDLGEAVAAMNEDRGRWDDVGKDADAQMDKIRALDERTGGGLQVTLGEYLAAEERVTAAKADVGVALDEATAAGHEVASAYDVVKEQQEEENAAAKKAEVTARDKEIRDSVRHIKQILSIGEKIAGIAGSAMTGNVPGLIGGAFGLANTMVDAEDIVATDTKLYILSAQLAQIDERRLDHRRNAKSAALAAANGKLDAAKKKITSASASLRAAKLDVGKAMTKLSTVEKKNPGKKHHAKGASTVFGEIKDTSDTTQFLVGVEGEDSKTKDKENLTPTQQFGEGTLRALAGELLQLFTTPAILRGADMDIRLDTDKEVVDSRKGTFNIPQQALDAISRWENVWWNMSHWLRGYRQEHADIVRTLHKLVEGGATGSHFDKRREILGHIAAELKVSRE